MAVAVAFAGVSGLSIAAAGCDEEKKGKAPERVHEGTLRSGRYRRKEEAASFGGRRRGPGAEAELSGVSKRELIRPRREHVGKTVSATLRDGTIRFVHDRLHSHTYEKLDAVTRRQPVLEDAVSGPASFRLTPLPHFWRHWSAVAFFPGGSHRSAWETPDAGAGSLG